MKILITGASGFIGRYVIDTLTTKYNNIEIVALSSSNIPGILTLEHNDYKFDSNYLSMNGHDDIEVILHLGSFTPKNQSESNDIEKSNSNIFSTQSLLNLKLPKLKRIIFSSAIDVYGRNEQVIDEQSLVQPISLYGHSKLYCEKIIEQYCFNKGLICQILRIGHTYGPGEEKYNKLIPVILRNVINNQDITIIGDGNERRTYIYVQDVANAICKAIFIKENIGIINVVGDFEKSVNEIVELILSLTDKKIKTNRILQKNEKRDLKFENSKLKNNLLESSTSFEFGIKEEINYLEKLDENFL